MTKQERKASLIYPDAVKMEGDEKTRYLQGFEHALEWTKDPKECQPEKINEKDQEFCMAILDFFVKHKATQRSVVILENALWLARLANAKVAENPPPAPSKLILLT